MPSGITTNERLRCLRPVLQEWIAINDQLGEEWREFGGAPWWYNERALVSLFAGAIWRKGGKALEEYSEHKRGKQRKASGRIDLWFAFRNLEYMAEAKQCWLRTLTHSRALQKAIDSMSLAKDDVGSLNPDRMRRLALVFGAPMIPKRYLHDLPAQIEKMEAVAQDKSIGADAVAWIFPTLAKPPISSDGYICPGIILWIKEVRRSRR